jgi:hypothetical protein
MLRCATPLRLAPLRRIRYLWNPAVRPENPAGGQTAPSRPTAGNGESYDRFPMGKGQPPGTNAGLGVSGAGSSAAGWAEGVSGEGRRRGAAGFFLAAFFRADFTVGFFFAVFRAADPRAGLPRRAAFRAGWRVSFFLLAADFRVTFFFLAAVRVRAAFFLVAI